MPKIVDHDRQRELLLDACFRLFAEEGYEGTTMRRIAREAGVSTGTLYHYFPDKRALLSGLFDLWTRRDVVRISTSLPERASVPVRIRVLIRFFHDHADHFRTLLRLVLEVHRHEPEPERRAEVREAVVRYRAAAGEVLGLDGVALHMAFSFLLGSLVHGLLDPGGDNPEGEEALVQLVWKRFTDEG